MRAINKIRELKPHIAIWWASGAQHAQLMKDGEVDMTTGWNGRFDVAIADGAKASYNYDGALLDYDCFGIVKGAPNRHEIRFSRGGTLRFHVSGADGGPLCGARIRLCLPDGSPVFTGYAGLHGAVHKRSSFKTDTDGNCTCERVLAGRIRVRIDAEGHAEATRDVKVEDGKEASLSISMKKN